MLLALTGFVMIGLLMYFLLKGKAIPVTLFVVLPIIGALINGFGIADITDYINPASPPPGEWPLCSSSSSPTLAS